MDIREPIREPSEADEARWAKWADLRARKEAATTDEEREALAHEEMALRDQGIRELLEDDMAEPEGWWWLSFVGEEGFLGVAIVRAGGVMEAALNARVIGCNPGGEVAAYPIPEEHVPHEQYRNRLLSMADLEEMNGGNEAA